MDIKKLIQIANQLCSEYMTVRKISFETYFDFETNNESMDLTIFYSENSTGHKSNFSATVWSHDPAYSVELLLKKLEEELVRFHPARTTSTSIILEK